MDEPLRFQARGARLEGLRPSRADFPGEVFLAAVDPALSERVEGVTPHLRNRDGVERRDRDVYSTRRSATSRATSTGQVVTRLSLRRRFDSTRTSTSAAADVDRRKRASAIRDQATCFDVADRSRRRARAHSLAAPADTPPGSPPGSRYPRAERAANRHFARPRFNATCRPPGPSGSERE